jgi:hypothetical protein
VGRVREHKVVLVEDLFRFVVDLVVGGKYREGGIRYRDFVLVAAMVRELAGDGSRLLGGRIRDTREGQ